MLTYKAIERKIMMEKQRMIDELIKARNEERDKAIKFMENPALIHSYIEKILNANLEEYIEGLREYMISKTLSEKKDEFKHIICFRSFVRVTTDMINKMIDLGIPKSIAFDTYILKKIADMYIEKLIVISETSKVVKLKDLKERLEQEGLQVEPEKDHLDHLYYLSEHYIEISAKIPTFPRFIDDTNPNDEIIYELTRESEENIIRKLTTPKW